MRLVQISETRGIDAAKIVSWEDNLEDRQLRVGFQHTQEYYEGDERETLLAWLKANSEDATPDTNEELAGYKFNVGDTVITTQGLYKSLPLGTVGKITRIDPNQDGEPYIIRADDDNYDYYAEDEIQLYTEIDATDKK